VLADASRPRGEPEVAEHDPPVVTGDERDRGQRTVGEPSLVQRAQ
jgi:hypothetical protein